MIEATTDPALRRTAEEAHRQRSLAAWRMIGAIRGLPAQLAAWHMNRAAQQDGPSQVSTCAV